MAPSARTAVKKRVAAASVAVALLLTGMKLAVGVLTGSLGIISEAAHSGLDLLAAIMTYLTVRVSDKPADPEHPYGHQKFENASALFETLLLVVTCAWIIYEAIERLFFKPAAVEVVFWSYAVIGVAIVLDFFRSRELSRVARETGSQALEADALHFSSDIFSSLVVLAGLVFTRLGWPAADALAALGVASLVIVISFRLGWRAMGVLVDRVPSDHVARARSAAATVPGVRRVYDVRVREAGDRHFVDLKVAVDPTAPLRTAHSVTEAVESAVRKAFGKADVMVHAEPGEASAASMPEQAAVLAAREGAELHHLVVHEAKEGWTLEVHLEFPGGTTLRAAHDAATRLERALGSRFPRLRSIQTHLESVPAGRGTRRDTTVQRPELVRACREVAAAEAGVVAVENVQVLQGGQSIWVALTCALGGEVDLEEAHRVATRVEARVHALDPAIVSVTVHTEPEPAVVREE
jgi:cation diffusion facilitator family transporter